MIASSSDSHAPIVSEMSTLSSGALRSEPVALEGVRQLFTRSLLLGAPEAPLAVCTSAFETFGTELIRSGGKSTQSTNKAED